MNLYIKESHPHNEETILFVHSYNMAGWMWDEQLKALNDYHCLVPDLPEHGKSGEAGQFTIDGTADAIIDLIGKQAHGGKAHLVGMSLGAQIILQILSKAPEVVDHVLISGALVNTVPATSDFLKLLDDLFEVYIPAKNENLSIGSYIRSYNMPKGLIEKFKESTYTVSFDSCERIIRENLLFKKPVGLEDANVPVLVMWGEKDYKQVKEHAHDLVEILPNSKTCVAPGVGHMWNMESPELFNMVLRTWIAEQNVPDKLKEI